MACEQGGYEMGPSASNVAPEAEAVVLAGIRKLFLAQRGSHEVRRSVIGVGLLQYAEDAAEGVVNVAVVAEVHNEVPVLVGP
jgi:hypothetical protein